jgi:hypothetical protein
VLIVGRGYRRGRHTLWSGGNPAATKLVPRRLTLGLLILGDEDDQVPDYTRIRGLHRHWDACRRIRCLGANDKAPPLVWSVRIYRIRKTAGRANLSKGFQPPDQPSASPPSRFPAGRYMAIEQNVDVARARRRPGVPILFEDLRNQSAVRSFRAGWRGAFFDQTAMQRPMQP